MVHRYRHTDPAARWDYAWCVDDQTGNAWSEFDSGLSTRDTPTVRWDSPGLPYCRKAVKDGDWREVFYAQALLFGGYENDTQAFRGNRRRTG